MKFYEIDNALIEAGDKQVRVRIAIDLTGKGDFENVFERDIVEADFYGLKEAAGGLCPGGKCYWIIPWGCIHIPERGRGHK
jgi:hypothetical protein